MSYELARVRVLVVAINLGFESDADSLTALAVLGGCQQQSLLFLAAGSRARTHTGAFRQIRHARGVYECR